ncbi:MAG TPA: hypothetical protein VKR31_15765 [Rhizomicrobium sp.]|nr:hypothetical protein [Rhizomicrobium sp.]
MTDVLRQLAGGDRRSIGASNHVVRRVLADRSTLKTIIGGITSQDAIVRMRCADVAEKVSVVHPDWLQPRKKALLRLAACVEQRELRWHLAQMLPRLVLSAPERRLAAQLLHGYLHDRSTIVRVCSMEGLACFAENDSRLRTRLLPLFETLRRTGSPAIRARARKLIARLGPLVGQSPRRNRRSINAVIQP